MDTRITYISEGGITCIARSFEQAAVFDSYGWTRQEEH